MSYVISSVTLSDLFTFGKDTCLDLSGLPNNAMILVVGVNKDSEGASSNGAGKSNLLNSVPFALFGKVPGKISADDVIRRGKTSGNAQIVLASDNGSKITIGRGRGGDKKYLLFNVDGEDKVMKTDTETQVFMNRYFGIDNQRGFEDFLNSVYFSSAFKAFLSKEVRPGERMELISRLLLLTVLDRCAESVHADFRGFDSDVGKAESGIKSLKYILDSGEFNEKKLQSSLSDFKGERAAFEDEIANLKEVEQRFANLKGLLTRKNYTIDQYDVQLASLRREYEQCSSLILEKEDLYELQTNLSNKADPDELQRLKGIALPDLESQLSGLQGDLREVSYQIQEKKKVLSKIDREPWYECPKCSSKLLFKREKLIIHNEQEAERIKQTFLSEVSELKKRRESFDDKWKKTINSREDLRKRIASMEGAVVELEGVQVRLESCEVSSKRLLEVDREGKDIVQRKAEDISALQSNISAVEAELGAFTEESIRDRIEEVDGEIKGLIEKSASTRSRLEEVQRIRKEIESQESLLKAIVAKRELAAFWDWGFPEIKRRTVEEFLPAFESRVNSYLSILDTSMTVRASTVRETKAGGVISEFTLEVNDGHSGWADFDTFSEGEKTRLSMAVGLAFRAHSLGMSSFGFTLFDEVLDKLDDIGTARFLDLLRSFPGQKILISHSEAVSLSGGFDAIVYVTKEDKVSTVSLSAEGN